MSSMYAVVEVAGLQYRVTKDQQLETQKVDSKKDKTFHADKVLLVKDGKKIVVGSPYVKGASVTFDVLKDFKGEKTIAYKFKRRKSFHWKKGHKQDMSLLKVKDIKAE